MFINEWIKYGWMRLVSSDSEVGIYDNKMNELKSWRRLNAHTFDD